MLPGSAGVKAHFLVVVSGLQEELANRIHMSSAALLWQRAPRSLRSTIPRFIFFLKSQSSQPWLGDGEQVFWH